MRKLNFSNWVTPLIFLAAIILVPNLWILYQVRSHRTDSLIANLQSHQAQGSGFPIRMMQVPDSIVKRAQNFLEEQHRQWYIREKKPRSQMSIINGSQETFFIKNHFFSNSFKDLKTGIFENKWYEDQWYIYSIRSVDRSAFNYMIPKKQDLKSYVGAVFAVFDADGKLTLLSIRCKTKSSGIIQPADPVYRAGKLVCGEGTEFHGRKTFSKSRYDSAGRLIERIYPYP